MFAPNTCIGGKPIRLQDGKIAREYPHSCVGETLEKESILAPSPTLQVDVHALSLTTRQESLVLHGFTASSCLDSTKNVDAVTTLDDQSMLMVTKIGDWFAKSNVTHEVGASKISFWLQKLGTLFDLIAHHIFIGILW